MTDHDEALDFLKAAALGGGVIGAAVSRVYALARRKGKTCEERRGITAMTPITGALGWQRWRVCLSTYGANGHTWPRP